MNFPQILAIAAMAFPDENDILSEDLEANPCPEIEVEDTCPACGESPCVCLEA